MFPRSTGRAAVPALLFGGLVACGGPAIPAVPARVTRTPLPVEVAREADGRWQLLRDGRPYTLRGAGADGDLARLAAAGATSFRTWGVGPETAAQLDEAATLGLTVALGVWLGHVGDGFDWHDPEQIAAQREAVRQAVLAHRDHPALLLWGIGNEMELGNDDPVMWREVGELVRMVEALDPNHPTMVVTAELGEDNAGRLREHVPDVDLWGINSYGGLPSLAERLDAAGWDRPYVVTELGTPGEWEVAHTPWAAPIEATSTAKAAAYQRALSAAADDPRCLGAYAFVWARGRTPADTWYPLLGPGDVVFEPVDALVEAWSGTPPRNRAPSVRWLEASFAARTVAPGTPLDARLDAEDPEGEALRYAWVLHRDGPARGPFGAVHACEEGAATPTFAAAAPTTPGAWRLFVVAADPFGRAAYASARFFVEGTPPEGPALPFWVAGPFTPSGWMGDARDTVSVSECPPRPGFCQGPCSRFAYRGGGDEGWAAVAWMHPRDNWRGERPGVAVPPGARAVELTAWGERGGERLTFSVGNWEVDGFSRQLEDVALTTEPTAYRIELDAGVREDVVFGFTWSAADPGPEGIAFHVADVRWVGADAPDSMGDRASRDSGAERQ